MGAWSVEERDGQHITWKELKAIHIMLQQYWLPARSSVLIRSDCSAAVACINNQGSTRSLELQQLSEEIFTQAAEAGHSLVARHISGSQNVTADRLSRSQPVATEWMLRREEFERIQAWHGLLEVDLFATPRIGSSSFSYPPMSTRKQPTGTPYPATGTGGTTSTSSHHREFSRRQYLI